MEDKQQLMCSRSLARKNFLYTNVSERVCMCVSFGEGRDIVAHELHAHPSLPLLRLLSTRERDNQRASFTARI